MSTPTPTAPPIAIITIAIGADGVPVVASNSIARDRVLVIARALAELQTQLIDAAAAPREAEPAASPPAPVA